MTPSTFSVSNLHRLGSRLKRYSRERPMNRARGFGLMGYDKKIELAWESVCETYEEGSFTPELEEDVQCYLYHSLVEQLGGAREIHAKVSRGKRLKKGEWKFPDLSLGKDELVVEIKFVSKKATTEYANSVKRSAIESMRTTTNNDWYAGRRRMLVYFDARKHLWEVNRDEIRKENQVYLYFSILAKHLLSWKEERSSQRAGTKRNFRFIYLPSQALTRPHGAAPKIKPQKVSNPIVALPVQSQVFGA